MGNELVAYTASPIILCQAFVDVFFTYSSFLSLVTQKGENCSSLFLSSFFNQTLQEAESEYLIFIIYAFHSWH